MLTSANVARHGPENAFVEQFPRNNKEFKSYDILVAFYLKPNNASVGWRLNSIQSYSIR
jgi:hypothetical protein